MNNDDEKIEGEIENLPLHEENELSTIKIDAEKLAEFSKLNESELNVQDEEITEKPKPIKPAIHVSLTNERRVLIVDEAGERRNETIEIIKQVLSNAEIATADNPEQAQREFEKGEYDTCVVNFLMPGYSSSDFVKSIANNPSHPLLVGFSADKMSDAYDPKKGIKIKPLRRIFEIDVLKDEENEDEVDANINN